MWVASFGAPMSLKTLFIPSAVFFLFSGLIPSQTEN
jgi:hypothetical protein